MVDQEYNTYSFVKCRECGALLKIITNTHLKKCCGLSSKEYLEKYPGEALSSQEHRDKMSKSKIPKIKTKITPIIEELTEKFIEEDIIDNKNEEIKNLSKEKTIKEEEFIDPFSYDDEPNKSQIIYFLTEIFGKKAIKKNHFIEKRNIDGNILYSYVTDICNIKKKIDFEFPNAFWHNSESVLNVTTRNNQLIEDGWKIISIKKRMPKIMDIKNILIESKIIKA